LAAALIAGLVATSALAQERDQEQDIPELVGEVSLVLGKAYIENGARDRHQIEAGSPVRVSDQILTGANGHVHVRFIDQALVSVRPDSKLEIVRYDYDTKNPDRSVVKFNLLEGVTRSISGAAAKNARQRFRLNTPIAAIGVRGTDFVVSASSDMVRALVNEGTIVMAPYSDQCSADTFGPCVNNAIELTGDSLQVLELDANSPSVTPAVLARNPALFREELRLAAVGSSDDDQSSDAENKSEGSEVYLEGVTSVRLAADARQAALTEQTSNAVSVVDFTPPAPVASQQLTDRQLVWGRWSWAEGLGDLERITLTSAEAEAGRDITVGNGWYGLFRDQNGGTARVQSGLGVVGFSLSSAQAFYSSESGIVAMQVTDGALNIDFERRTFSTELNLQHASTGLIDFNAMGRIYSGGYFYDRSDMQNVVGAVSLDGQEAGYFFDKQLESGGIQGLTLWDSQ
ncbi:MAG: FecR family protein, partial [Gammaproteobacteria bacterium]|nr:FecR family protein [Gammaproteobacteria bacterium]